MSEYYRADALGFLAPQGKPPVAIPDLPEHVDLLGVTAAPPFFVTNEQILYGDTTPDGKQHLPGLEGFREFIDSQEQLAVVESSQDIAHYKL